LQEVFIVSKIESYFFFSLTVKDKPIICFSFSIFPDTAAAAVLTEPAAIGFPVTHAETSEAAGGGGGPGLGGRYHHSSS
jgi:hypothetical protein